MPAPDELSLFAGPFEAIGAPYMITGATAAILYGQPRVTNDLDIVIRLDDHTRTAFLRAFPEMDFYVPPETVIRTEQARRQRGHFNVIHHETGYKADVYLSGGDPLHAWALPLRRRVPWSAELTISVAPPEYVVLRKLEYYREGGSSKHPADIRAILESTGVDESAMRPWLEQLGLGGVWEDVRNFQ
jgi:hypothetical protein